VAVLLAALGGYLLAGAALRPVERMRARAAGVSPDSQGARLPAPKGNDEIARLGRTLNAMLGRLEQARERERRFLADASHELRTPLALLKTEIELALDGGHSVEELLASLRSARAETDRLVQLSEDLLVLAQSDQGSLPVRLVPIVATELAQRIAARFAPRAAGESREIDADAPRGLTLLADPLRIEQALANLVDNSLRYGAGRITIHVVARGAEVELHVRDEGGGIPPELRSRAFERFTRNDPARRDGGAGLGLAIVAVIARAHGGAAEIGRASDLFIRLPSATLDCSARSEPPVSARR
jgi:signal transduction histidine kinase